MQMIHPSTVRIVISLSLTELIPALLESIFSVTESIPERTKLILSNSG